MSFRGKRVLLVSRLSKPRGNYFLLPFSRTVKESLDLVKDRNQTVIKDRWSKRLPQPILDFPAVSLQAVEVTNRSQIGVTDWGHHSVGPCHISGSDNPGVITVMIDRGSDRPHDEFEQKSVSRLPCLFGPRTGNQIGYRHLFHTELNGLAVGVVG